MPIDDSDIAPAIALAQEHSTPSEQLAELAEQFPRFHSQYSEIFKALAANPNCPAALLFRLTAQYPAEVLNNPVFPLLLLEQPDLLDTLPLEGLQALLRQPDAPLFLREQAAEKAEEAVQLDWMNDPDTPKSVLKRLLNSRFIPVVDGVQLHVNWAGEVEQIDWQRVTKSLLDLSRNHRDISNRTKLLASLCSLPKSLVRCWSETHQYPKLCEAVAASLVASPTLLTELSQPEVGLAIAKTALKNPRFPLEVLEARASEQSSEPEAKILAQTAREQLEQRNSSSQREPVIVRQRYRSQRRQQPRIVTLNPGLTSGNTSNRANPDKAEAASPDTSPERLTQLARHPALSVRRAVMRNSRTPLQSLFQYSFREPRLYGDLMKLMSEAGRGSGSSGAVEQGHQLLHLLADISTDSFEQKLQRFVNEGPSHCHFFLAKRPNTCPCILHQLAQQSNPQLQEVLAEHPQLRAETLVQLAQSTAVEVLEAVAYHSNTPGDCLDELAASDHVGVRCNVAHNPHTSPTALAQLRQDDNVRVRERAYLDPHMPTVEVTTVLSGEDAGLLLRLRPELAQDYPESVAAMVRHDCQTKHPTLRYLALCCDAAPVSALERASQSTCWLDRLAAAMHGSTPLAKVAQLQNDSNQLVRAAAQRQASG